MTASSRGRTRLAETAIALASGGALDAFSHGPAWAEAQTVAGPLTDIASVAGALGGLVAAMVHFAGIALVPPTEGRARNLGRALVESLFSVVVGSIVGNYLAAPLAAGLPWVPASSAPVVAFGLGVFAWQTAPGVIGGVKLAASRQRVARALLGVLSRWAEPGDAR